MTSRMTTAWLTGAALILCGGMASATPSITFDQVNQGGTIAYSVVGGSLVGTGIVFEFFTVAGTSADGVYTCDSCTLSFTTGNAYGDTDGPLYTFGGGGSFVLTGGVGAMGIPLGSVLLSGTFTSTPINVAVAQSGIITFTAAGVDTKNADLAAFLGIDPLQWRYTNSEFSLGEDGGVVVNPDGTFSGNVTQADLQNVKAPEPASSLLLLLGIGSLLAYRRKRA